MGYVSLHSSVSGSFWLVGFWFVEPNTAATGTLGSELVRCLQRSTPPLVLGQPLVEKASWGTPFCGSVHRGHQFRTQSGNPASACVCAVMHVFGWLGRQPTQPVCAPPSPPRQASLSSTELYALFSVFHKFHAFQRIRWLRRKPLPCWPHLGSGRPLGDP